MTDSRIIGLQGVVALYMLIVLVSCGDSPDRNPVSPTPAPAPAAPRLLQQGNLALAAPTDDSVYFALASITDAASGRWEATVDWGDAANTLWMWVADGACTVDQFARDDCPFEATCPCRFAIRSETGTPKPRVLTIPGASGGTRTLIVANLGPGEETAQYRVTLLSSGVAAGASAGTAGVTGDPGVSLARKARLARR